MNLSQTQNPSKLFEIKRKRLKMRELEITYPYFAVDEQGKTFADHRKNYVKPKLKIFKHELRVMRDNSNTYLDLLWLEKDRLLVGTLLPQTLTNLLERHCWLKCWIELTEIAKNIEGNKDFPRHQKNAVECLDYINSQYFKKYISVVKKRSHLPPSGFRAFEIDNWYSKQDESGNLVCMKGFIRNSKPEKDARAFLTGKKFSQVIFYPHTDGKMKVKKESHENMLRIDDSLSFIKKFTNANSY